VLKLEDVVVGEPGPGQARVRHEAVGLNFADTYFRSGLYKVPLPNGLGVEAAGVVEAVGEGVQNVRPGDRVTYTGFLNTLGAYSTSRLIPAAPLIKLPDAIACETAAAMTMRGLTSAYLMRRIWPLKAGDAILFHAAAGGVGSIACQWAKLLGLTVIGTVSTDAKAAVARAHGCDHTIVYGREDVAARVRELTGGAGVAVAYDSVGRTRTPRRSRRSSGGACSFASAPRRARSRRSTRWSSPSRARCTSRARRSPTTSPILPRRPRLPASCSITSPRAASASTSASAIR
jgi:NADPH2:quinone reductase